MVLSSLLGDSQRKIRGNSVQNSISHPCPQTFKSPSRSLVPSIRPRRFLFLFRVCAYNRQRASLRTTLALLVSGMRTAFSLLCITEKIQVSRVCQLWKMLVEHSAPWRHVPDIIQTLPA